MEDEDSVTAPAVSPALSPILDPDPSSAPDPEPGPGPGLSPGLSPALSPALSPGLSPTLSPTLSPALSPGLSPGHGVTMANSDECYFCAQRVYALERISAEGKFFHRSCFKCHKCRIRLRLGGYSFDQATGRFYCEQHSEELELANGAESSHKKKGTGENGLSSDDSDDFEYILDCVPPPPSHPQSHDGEDKYIPKPKGGALQEKWTNEENGLSSDDNGDFEYVLDCAPPPAPSQPQSHDGQDQHILEPKGDVLKPRTPTKSPSQVKAKTPAEETADLHPPVPKPRHSRNLDPQPSPVAKPRTVHLLTPSAPEKPSTPTKETAKTTTDPRPKQSLRKLQLTDEEKSQLVNLQSLSADSDSETHGGSSSCSSSSATAGGPSPPKPEGTDGQEEEGYWSGSTSGHVREKRNRRCFRRKEMPSGQTRVRSKFSPWNLSSPRISRDGRLSVLVNQPGRVETTFRYVHSPSEEGADGDDDDDIVERDDIDLFDEKMLPSDPVEAEKLELMKMKTLERRARMSEVQRFRKAQSIQRRLEEIEVNFKELEDKGVVLERTLRGEAGSDSPDTIEQWIQLVHEKNALVSEESDLMVASKQLELEDKQGTLELELRKFMGLNDKTPEQQVEEENILQQMLEVVDMRDSLVSFLEEKRLKEMSEEQEAFTIMEAKRHSKAGAQVFWE